MNRIPRNTCSSKIQYRKIRAITHPVEKTTRVIDYNDYSVDLEEMLIHNSTSHPHVDAINIIKRLSSKKEKYILYMYYVRELTYEQIGNQLHLSRERVRQYHTRAIKHLLKYESKKLHYEYFA